MNPSVPSRAYSGSRVHNMGKLKLWKDAAARQRAFQIRKREGLTEEEVKQKYPDLLATNAPPWTPAAEQALEDAMKPVIQENRQAPAVPYTPLSTKLDLNDILNRLKLMDPLAYPAYSNLLKQLNQYKKKIIVQELVQFLNDCIL